MLLIGKLLSALLICLELVDLISGQLIPHGTKQIFNFENEIHLEDNKQTPQPLAYKLEGTLSIASIWKLNKAQLLHFQIKNVQLKVEDESGEFKLQSTSINNYEKCEFYLLLENDIPEKLLIQPSKDISLINFQRGIASLLQFKYTDEIVREKDASGNCNVLYQAKSSTKYNKIKTDCFAWDMKVHYRTEKPLSITVNSFQEIEYIFNQERSLNKLYSIENHSVHVEAKKDVGNEIKSKIALVHSSSLEVTELKAVSLKDVLDKLVGYENVELEFEIDGSLSEEEAKLKTLVKSLKSDMTDDKVGTQEMASALLKLFPVAKITKKEEFVQILKARSMQNIRNALLDLLAMTQTEEAHLAVMETLKIENEEHFDQLERYLQSLSVGTRSQTAIIEHLYNQLNIKVTDNSKLLDTLVQTLSAVTAKYAKLSPEGYDHEVVKKVTNKILTKLALCKTTECSNIYIRALRNLQDPSTISNLINIALNENTLNSVNAMKALRSFPIRHFDNEVRKNLEKIFYQIRKKFDSSARILALDILLDMSPTKEQLTDFIVYLTSSDKEFEIKTYLLQKLATMSEKCSKFSSLVQDILKNTPEVNNYHVQAQKGLTTVLFRNLSTYPSFIESLYSVQESYKGVLKQGTVDIKLHAGNGEVNLFSLGLFTRGLSSFVGDSSSNSEDENVEEESTTAGMEIAVQGVHFRPLIFFNSQSELMGHVWSGTASDPTPAYQATTLLQDHEEYLILQNGITVYIRGTGAQSIDLNGQITFSIWNRNAHTEINSNTGTVIDGFITLGTSFIRQQSHFVVLNEPKINVVVDCDFYSDILMCLQLSRPESKLRHQISKKQIINGTNLLSKKLVSLIYRLPGNTLTLNRKNNEMCNKIFL